MATNTTNYSLIKPAVNDPTDADRWGNQLNENLDDIDSELYEAQYGTASYAVSSGAAINTYEVTYTPAIIAYTAGLKLSFKAHQANTGASTLNVNALGAKNITKDITSSLAANDIKADQVVTVIYDGTNFQLASRSNTSGSVINTQGDVITGDSAGAEQRLALGALGMSLVSDGTDAVWGFPYSNYEVFDSAGVNTFTTPTGVTKVMVACWGAGGGGGGGTEDAVFPNSGYRGQPGAGGGFTFGIFTPGVTETVTIGSGGTGGTWTAWIGGGNTGNDGSDGTVTSFGSHCTANGGGGGDGALKGVTIATGGASASGILNIGGGNAIATAPACDAPYDTEAANKVVGGNSSIIGGGGLIAISTADTGLDGNDGNTGGGGSGGVGGFSGSSTAGDGGDGGDGLVIVFW